MLGLVLLIVAQPALSTPFVLAPQSDQPGAPVVVSDARHFVVAWPAASGLVLTSLLPGQQTGVRWQTALQVNRTLTGAGQGDALLLADESAGVWIEAGQARRFPLAGSCVAGPFDGRYVVVERTLAGGTAMAVRVREVSDGGTTTLLDAGGSYSFTDTVLSAPFCASTNVGNHEVHLVRSSLVIGDAPATLTTMVDGVVTASQPAATGQRLVHVGSGPSGVLLIGTHLTGTFVTRCLPGSTTCTVPQGMQLDDVMASTWQPKPIPGQSWVFGQTGTSLTVSTVNAAGAVSSVTTVDAGTLTELSAAFVGTVGLLVARRELDDAGAELIARWVNAGAAGDPCSSDEGCASGACSNFTCLGGGGDAGASDGGASDAGSSDAGASDAGASDAGSADGGAEDAGESGADAGATDAGAADAGEHSADAGPTDAGAVDASADGGRTDAGLADAGATSPQALSVGCSCGATDALGPWLFAALLLGCRRHQSARISR